MNQPRMRIVGGEPLVGDIYVSGSKNAALPLIAAILLTDQTVELDNVPHISDIVDMVDLLSHMGASVDFFEGSKLIMQARSLTSLVAPYELVSKIRASFLVLGPMLARYGKAKVALPGGDAIGSRPVDIHLKGLKEMGATIDLVGGNIEASCKKLKGAHIVLRFPSVNATQQLMMAAALADGETHLCGVAKEPEVVDLAVCLRAMGADIEGEGTERIIIRGVQTLSGVKHRVIGDRIEAGTYLMAAMMTGGNLTIHNANIHTMPAVWDVVTRLDSKNISATENTVSVSIKPGARLQSIDMTTQPFPGFATDLQPQFMSLMTLCEGESCITETLFENRFMHVPELVRMGADIRTQGNNRAYIRGVPFLSGAPVHATDIRASVSLIAAGLAAKGETWLSGLEHVDRGYQNLENKLQNCGAIIERVEG